MLTRFLKGQDFHDRPLVSYAGSHLPDEELSAPTTNDHHKESSVADEPKQSEFSAEPVKPKVMSVGTVVLIVVLIASAAFVLGVWVARRTMVSPNLAERSVEVQPLKERDNYGSI